MTTLPPPQSESELLQRCRSLAGLTLAEVATLYHQTLPNNPTKAKGFVGQLIEQALGAASANLPEPDFPHLGIELKTLPLNAKGIPQETTYVCTAPYTIAACTEQWENSRVWKKLARVLWVPFDADPNIPLAKRRVGTALLWSPDLVTAQILREDWEELSTMLQLGQNALLSAKIGTYLHLRPKAAHSRILSPFVNEMGEVVQANPKGFYLRTALTRQVVTARI
jgi:DNA mismatch repair protein MutH